ncbi:hypothetical protein [Streptomyces sp. NPDC006785]|uniref:hypothetical protein n=1 Tax=Streptomyces sp. NPDC006785 TaxID=3155461 RepID=UPI0033EBCAFA
MDLFDQRHELLVAELAGRLRPLLAGEVRRRGQLKHPAAGIDPETLLAQVVDHLLGLVRGRSISWAKNTEAAFRISCPRLNSATSLRSCFSSSSSAVLSRSSRPQSSDTTLTRCFVLVMDA